MIKILWDQCEVQIEQETPYSMAQAGYGRSTVLAQCGSGGKERTFADGHKEVMCDNHWARCTGIVDKDGAKHMKSPGESVLT